MGVRILFFSNNFYYFFRGPCKNLKPYDNPFWGFEQRYQEIKKSRKGLKFPLAPMGVLAPGSAHARPSARPPIDTSGNFQAHMSAESPSNISPNHSEVISEVSEPYQYHKLFWDIFEISTFSGQNRVIWGGRGVPRNFFLIGILIFMLLRSPCKKLKNNGMKKKRKEEKINYLK